MKIGKMIASFVVPLLAVSFFVVTLVSANDPTVYAAQKRLKDFGHDPGPIDGIVGSKTVQAVKAFQVNQGLPVTGRLDADTLQKLGVNVASDASESSRIAPSQSQPQQIRLPKELTRLPTNEEIAEAQRRGCTYYWVGDRAMLVGGC